MIDVFKMDGLSVEMQPSITKWDFEDLGDNPETHRWRAWWASQMDGKVIGIELKAYPVIKTNPVSVWINKDAYRQYRNGVIGWERFDPQYMRKQLCHNGSGSAWAKPTQDEAIHSLAVRLCRWSTCVAHDVRKVKSAASVLENLKPNHAWASRHVIKALEE